MKIAHLLSLSLFFVAPLHAQAVKPDTIRLSLFQQAELKALKAQADEIAKQQNIILRTLIAGVRDPGSIGDWALQLTDSTLILTPPKPVAADSSKLKPKKP